MKKLSEFFTLRFALNKNGHIISFWNFQKVEDCILPHHASEVHVVHLSNIIRILNIRHLNKPLILNDKERSYGAQWFTIQFQGGSTQLLAVWISLL